jgi:pimeloyl-ACP methyl ester carboxylesterase
MMSAEGERDEFLKDTRSHTFYFCGTLFDRNSDDLIANLYKADQSVEFDIRMEKVKVPDDAKNFKTILDGVGSEIVTKNRDSFGDKHSTMWDIATADSMENMLGDCESAAYNTKPTRINIIGWSRGGMATFRAAEMLCEKFSVRMFAIDPVPGPVAAAPKLRECSIPARVQRAVIILALHENSMAFRFFLPPTAMDSDERSRRIEILYFPGTHYTPVAPKSKATAGKNTVSVLVRDYAEKALRHWGTPLNQDRCLKLLDIDVLEKYSKLVVNFDSYNDGAWFYSGKGLTERLPRFGEIAGKEVQLDPIKKRDNKFIKGDKIFFINGVHLRVFLYYFPNIANSLLGKTYDRGGFEEEKKLLKNVALRTFRLIFGALPQS